MSTDIKTLISPRFLRVRCGYFLSHECTNYDYSNWLILIVIQKEIMNLLYLMALPKNTC